jgi:alcohol dehydrogenase class IV
VLGATFGVAHGALNSVILLHAVTFNALVVVSELTVAAYRLGLAQDSKNVTD